MSRASFPTLAVAVGVALASAVGASAFAQNAGPKVPTFQLGVGVVQGNYSQTSANRTLATNDETPDAKVQGQTAQMQLTVSSFVLDLGYAGFKGESDSYYETRTDTYVGLGKYFAFFPYVVPTVGYFQMTQESDRAHEDAPIAFVDDTSTFFLGLHAEGMPFSVNGHGLLFKARYHYLTNGETKNNFGTMYDVGAGYGYRGTSSTFGLMVGATRTYLHAGSKEDKTLADGTEAEVERDVRSILEGNTITLFMSF